MTMKQLRSVIEKLTKPMFKKDLTPEDQEEVYNLLINDPCVNFYDFTQFAYNETPLNLVLKNAKVEEERRKELGGVWYGYTEEMIEQYKEDVTIMMEEMDDE